MKNEIFFFSLKTHSGSDFEHIECELLEFDSKSKELLTIECEWVTEMKQNAHAKIKKTKYQNEEWT